MLASKFSIVVSVSSISLVDGIGWVSGWRLVVTCGGSGSFFLVVISGFVVGVDESRINQMNAQ